MKKFTALILVTLMAIAAMPFSAIAASPQNGNSTIMLSDMGDAGTTEYKRLNKNVIGLTGPSHDAGKSVDLNGDGDWYLYTADGNTYITLYSNTYQNLAFEVIDVATTTKVFSSSTEHKFVEVSTSGSYSQSTYYTQANLSLVSGRDYLIRFYSTTPIAADRNSYLMSVGYPLLCYETLSYNAGKAYSTSANISKTFIVSISGMPNSARIEKGDISFLPTNYSDRSYIKSLQIIAPNGQIFSSASGSFPVDLFDFDPANFSNGNIPLNGNWTITIKTSKAMNDLKFKISGIMAYIISEQ